METEQFTRDLKKKNHNPGSSGIPHQNAWESTTRGKLREGRGSTGQSEAFWKENNKNNAQKSTTLTHSAKAAPLHKVKFKLRYEAMKLCPSDF
jgi:hypothetical protein